jgi:hypothetical protein
MREFQFFESIIEKNHLISFDYLFFDEPCKVFTGLFYVPVTYYRALPVPFT